MSKAPITPAMLANCEDFDALPIDKVAKFLTVAPRSVYGKTAWMPVCDQARMFCEIAGTKTFTEEMLRIVKRNGWIVATGHTVPVIL